MVDELKNISKGIQELVQTTKKEFDKLAGKVGGEINSVMSDEMKMVSDHVKSGFDSFKNTGGKLLTFLTGTSEEGSKIGIAGLLLQRKEVKTSQETLKLQKKETKLQKDMHFWAKWRHKKSLAAFGKKAVKGIFWALFGIPLMMLGTAIGVLLGRILSPFKVLAKIRAVKWVVKFFRGLKIFKQLSGWLKTGKLLKPLRDVLAWFRKSKFLKFLAGPFLKGFKFGFTKLFWPLQIILSTIDFIKGYMESEGSMLDKIQGGIENVIVKFLEFPAKLLGKMVEWFQVNIMGKDPASIKQGSFTKGLIDGIRNMVGLIFKGWANIFSWITPALKGLYDLIMKIDWKALKNKIVQWGQNIWGAYEGLKNWILGLFGVDTTKKQKEIRMEDEMWKNVSSQDEGTALRNLRINAEKALLRGDTAEAERLQLKRDHLAAQITANQIADKTLKFMETNPNGTFVVQNNSTESTAVVSRVEELERGR